MNAKKRRAVLFWSGGKDSAVAYHRLITDPAYRDCQVSTLLTTFTEGYDRVTGHGVRRSLVEAQARSLGLDLIASYIPKTSSMRQYEDITKAVLRSEQDKGITLAAAGDIFVEKQRMALLRRVGLMGCCPLWEKKPPQHAEELIELGFKAYVICVDGAVLDASFVGRTLDREFLRDLPTGIDPCGENGEFHTFVFDGPIFREEIRCKLGRVVHREGFHFCDVLPQSMALRRQGAGKALSRDPIAAQARSRAYDDERVNVPASKETS